MNQNTESGNQKHPCKVCGGNLDGEDPCPKCGKEPVPKQHTESGGGVPPNNNSDHFGLTCEQVEERHVGQLQTLYSQRQEIEHLRARIAGLVEDLQRISDRTKTNPAVAVQMLRDIGQICDDASATLRKEP